MRKDTEENISQEEYVLESWGMIKEKVWSEGIYGHILFYICKKFSKNKKQFKK